MNMTENTKYGYVAFYKGKRYELYSDSLYHAQLDAAKYFKVSPKKSYTVHVVLAERPDGTEVIHVAS